MRKRSTEHGAQPYNNGRAHDDDQGKKTILKQLQRLDAFAQVEDDLRVRTDAGASLTLVFWVVVLVLLASESVSYFSKGLPKEHLVVDSSLGEKMKINLDMTFHRIPCVDLHVDVMDMAGDNQIEIDHSLTKQRLTAIGGLLGEPLIERVSEMEHWSKLPANYCGPCYGAEDSLNIVDGKACCNTCDELLAAYNRHGWATYQLKHTADQCTRERHLSTPLQDGEGCRISGYMEANKVAGNFHVAFGEGVEREGRHVHLFNPAEAPGFNVSHTIHSLSFGEPYPGMEPNPMDGISRIVHPKVKTGLFQYFVSIVPAVFRSKADGDGKRTELRTNRFSYTGKFTGIYGGNDWLGPASSSSAGATTDTKKVMTATELAKVANGGSKVDVLERAKADGAAAAAAAVKEGKGYIDTKKHHAAHGMPLEEEGEKGKGAELQGKSKGGGGDEDEEEEEEKHEPTAFLPGVFFVYELSPFMLEVTEHEKIPFTHFIIRLCAIAGGAFSLSGMLDKAIHYILSKSKAGGVLG